jgi:hypothetical protein
MGLPYHFANVLSGGLFLYYGLACLFANGMMEEFERYRLSRFRRATGALEVLGAAGLAAGYLFSPLTVLSAGGLSILMVLGLAVRVRVKDPILEMVPAAFLLLVNAFIAIQAVGRPV